VGAALNAVERQLKVKLGVTSPSGADLVVQAFNLDATPGDIRLRLPNYAEDRPVYAAAHEGVGSFGRGCFLAIRSVLVNSPEELDEQLAVEYIAALSVLARWIDEAEVVTV
jgi:hypothetical protein